MDQQIVTETPDTSLAAHMLAEATPAPVVETDTPAVEAVAEAVVTPEAEADSPSPDAELSEAARTLRRNRASERKAAIQKEINEAVREREQVRAELATLRREREALGAKPATAGAALPAASTDPSDPKPVLDQFDDFNAFVDARDEWVIRETARRADTRQRESESQRAEADQARVITERGQAAKEKFADYEAVVEPVIAHFTNNPRASHVAAFVANSAVGGEVFYRLGKDPTALQAVLTANDPFALARELARLESQITVPKPAPKPVTTAPAPPSKMVGGGASHVALDTNKPGVSAADHYRVEQAELAERRNKGHRY